MNGSARDRAARIVRCWLAEGVFPDHQVGRETRDRAFLMETVYGTVKWKGELEWILERLTDRLPSDPMVRAYLLTGLYQLFHLDQMPSYAVVDETVKGVKKAAGLSSARFANAVLRRALRERDSLRAVLNDAPPPIRFSHPDVLIKRWEARWGWEQTRRILVWDNGRPEVTVRVQQSRIPTGAVVERWQQAGVSFRPHPAFPERCIGIGRGREVRVLPGWEEGWFVVQDPSTLVPVELLAPEPGERILDACCAPGGKLSDIADRMRGKGRLIGLDVHGRRLKQAEENVQRLGLEGGVALKEGDAGDSNVLAEVSGGQPFDGVLLDVPCTNTGVLRRRPDARWRFSADGPVRMAEVQRSLLETVSAWVRSGGRLVYATCSLELEENRQLVESWLQSHPGWELTDEAMWLPGERETDGVYAARLVRWEH